MTIGLPEDLTFKGKGYNPDFDKERLSKAMRLVYDFMLDQQKHSLADISKATGKPEATVSAMLRALRNPENGGFYIGRINEGKGLWLYWLDLSKPSNLGAPSHKRCKPGVQPEGTGPAVVLDARAKAATDLAQYFYDECRRKKNKNKRGHISFTFTPIEESFVERMAAAAGLKVYE